MKKGCLIAVLALLGLLGAGGGGLYYYASQLLGLAEAPVVSHDTEVTQDTRFLLAAQPRVFSAFIESQVAAEIAKLDVPDALKKLILGYATAAVPNEVAVIANFDDGAQTLETKLFVNERIFGPIVATVTQNPNDYPQFKYQGPPFELPERGHLVAEWTSPYMYGVSDILATYWHANPPRMDMQLEGGHFIEALLDNREGEIFQALGVAIAQKNGSLAQLAGPAQSEPMRANLMKLISDAHCTLDRDESDRLILALACSDYPESPSPLAMRYNATSGPEVMALIEQQIATGQIALQDILRTAVEYMERFGLDWHFDNRQEEFMGLMSQFIDFDANEDLRKTGQNLKIVIKLMEESTLTAVMLDNGDLAGEWKVMSQPENAGSVYLTLSTLPINHPQGLLFYLRDIASQLNMRFEMSTAEMAGDAAYLQRFTIYNFQGGLRDLVTGRVGMPMFHLPPPVPAR